MRARVVGVDKVRKDPLVKIWAFAGHTFPVTTAGPRGGLAPAAPDEHVTDHSRVPIELYLRDADGGFGPHAVVLLASVPGDGSVC